MELVLLDIQLLPASLVEWAWRRGSWLTPARRHRRFGLGVGTPRANPQKEHKPTLAFLDFIAADALTKADRRSMSIPESPLPVARANAWQGFPALRVSQLVTFEPALEANIEACVFHKSIS